MSQTLEIVFSKKEGLLVKCPFTRLKSSVRDCFSCEFYGSVSVGILICNRFTVVKGALLDGQVAAR
jgi:hypothetical protein